MRGFSRTVGNLALLHLLALFVILFPNSLSAQTPLTTLNYKIVGTYLRVSPAAVAVPKGIAGSVLVELANSDGSDKQPDNAITQGAYIEATLRGPSFPARRLIGEVNKPLMLPALNLVGDYQLDNVRLVDATSGTVRMEGTPSSVPVRVFEEVLVSRVTSRPLTLAEIQEKGIVIDDQNFRAVEFEVGFVLDGVVIPVKFPVVSPDFTAAREIIPAAEIEKRLVEAQQINQQLAASGAFQLPDELQAAGLNIQVKGANFEVVEVQERDLRLRIPPIPALMVIPGNIGYLNQFFSVQIFTENASPVGSGLSVFNLDAKLLLPPGPDLVASTNYNAPGDDPLRFARVGANKIIQPVQAIRRPGPDGVLGTSDDINRLHPREAGQAEFLVEGLQEGLHVMDLELNGELDGLAAGSVKIKGRAAGSVLVRNPKFSLTFSHPRTVRTEEPYDAFVTILNTSQVEANFVSVTLPKGSISGGELMTAEKIELGTIKPGETRTAKYRIRAKRTGRITFSNLTTSEDSIIGRFKLRVGIDDRGVELSPDTIAYPDYVDRLPTEVFDAANRVIGQALGVATAPVLPPGVKPITFSVIEKHVLEMAEAGQRIAYGEATNRVLMDLLLDFQGGRVWNEGFNQIIQGGDAGREWREALALVIERNDGLNVNERLVAQAADVIGRGERWFLAASSQGAVPPHPSPLPQGGEGANAASSGLGTNSPAVAARAGVRGNSAYPSRAGHLQVSSYTNTVFHWQATNAASNVELSALLVSPNGTARLVRWTLNSVSAGACYSFTADPTNTLLRVDTDCDGEAEEQLAGTATTVNENPPQVLHVRAVPEVISVRPWPSCHGAPANNYATTLAVLFSKPMTQTNANVPTAYATDNGIQASFVRMQPGGRVALLNLKQGIGAVRPRALMVEGVRDARGNVMPRSSNTVVNLIKEGAAITGRVLRGDGSPAAIIPVTLTMNDVVKDPFDRCEPEVITKLAQVFTDENGSFTFDFIVAGVPYTISATDTGGLPPDVIREVIESWRGNRFDAEKFAARLVQTNILAQLGVATASEAVALAEGLDRAVWNDHIPYEPGAMGTERVVALRFRGRGTVFGKVVAADGVTPVVRAAVNLFPDPTSRELGRGIFTDSQGRFQFNGVPLGQFSLQVKASTGQFRTLAGLLSQPGQLEEINVALSAPTPEEIIRTSLSGLITEPDNLTPHSDATVFIKNSEGRVIGSAQTDSTGVFQFNNIPVGSYYIGAFSVDNRRKAERSGVQAIAGVTAFVQLPLNGTGRVVGKVINSAGQAVANAIVAGGEALVRSDATGQFTLTGVPLGRRAINAGLESKFAPQNFPRLGSASVDVLPGVDNYALVQLKPAGVIVGTVKDAKGQAVPFVNVAIPVPGGFAYTKANGSGVFRFINMPPGDYTVSAPAPPVSATEEELMEQLRSEDTEQILAALTEAFTTYSGVNNPALGGTNATFNPGSWGYTTTSIKVDGDTGEANITYLKQGTVSGKVLNHQGVPIGAKVRLTGIGPAENGAPIMTLLGDQNSDPAEGTFHYPNRLKVGDWGVQVASPFYAVVLSEVGRTTDADLNVTNLVFTFPTRQDTHGRLAGRVFYPDGTPVGKGVKVHTHFGIDGIHNTTDTNGFFDNAFQINAGSYNVDASDPTTGFKVRINATVVAGRSNYVEITLKGLGNIAFQVLQGNGQPARNAEVKIDKSDWPTETRSGITDTNGFYTANDLPVGRYGIAVKFTTSTTVLQGRTAVDVLLNQTSSTNLVLGATANITGTFRKRDTGEPIGAARVAIGNLAYAPTGTNGAFVVNGVPLGTYRIVAVDSVSGRRGVGSVTLSYQDQNAHIDLLEQQQGEIRGVLYEAGGTQVIPAAKVTLDPRDGLSPRRFVTTGQDGAFLFPGVTPGEFTLEAENTTDSRRVVQNGTFPDASPTLFVNLTLPPKEARGLVTVQVLRPGNLPGSNVTVTITAVGGGSATTDTNGVAVFGNIRAGGFTVRANSLLVNESFSQGETNGTLLASALQTNVVVRLSGVGTVKGRVLKSDNSGADFATLRLQFLTEPFRNVTRGPFTADANGDFTIPNVALGSYRLTAEHVALAGTTNGVITQAGQTNTTNVRLGASGVVIGRLVRANKTAPVPTNDVLILFGSQSSLSGNAATKTDLEGHFGFTNVPIGTVRVEAAALRVGGVAKAGGALSSNGQVLDLGDVVLDEDFPQVTGLSPEHGTSGVSTLASVDVLYNEPLFATTVNGNTNAIYLKAGTNILSSIVALTNHTDGTPRIIRITPRVPLKSLTTYDVVVINGERRNAVGTVIANGPTDLVGRTQLLPLIAQFTTRDDDPPQLVSLFPANNADRVTPDAVMRLSFNEPIRAGYSINVIGTNGPLPGTSSLSADGKILTFAPTAKIGANQSYTLAVSNILDLAGNRWVNEPWFTRFHGQDTIGPVVALIRVADNKQPVAGGAVHFETVLVTNEANVSVRYVNDFTPVGESAVDPYRVPITLPTNGEIKLRVTATDVFGNDGPFYETNVSVVANLAPAIALTRVSPTNGPVKTRQKIDLNLTASDDYQITNVTLVATVTPPAPLSGWPIVIRFTNAVSTNVSLNVPTNAEPGSVVTVRAQAIDGLGVSSAEPVLTMNVIDDTDPSLVIVGPPASQLINPANPLQVVLAAKDNSTNLTVTVTLSGTTASGSQTWRAPMANVWTTNVFTFSMTNVQPDGSLLTASIQYHDGATSQWGTSRSWTLIDTISPRLIGVTPTNGATRVSPWQGGPRLVFSDNISPASVLTNFLLMTNNAGMTNGLTATQSGSARNINVKSQVLPLALHESYFVTLLPGAHDGSSNAVLLANGDPLPPEGVTTMFTTAGVLSILPTNGTRLVAGQSFTSRIEVDTGFGASVYEWRFNGVTASAVSTATDVTNVLRTIVAPTNAGMAQLTIRASDSWDAITLTNLTLDIRSRDADDDGDGWLNGFEYDRGMNAFVANPDSEDFDNDGLNNGQERALGTDPGDSDTDNDLLADGSEVSIGTNPFNRDTDGDGIIDGQDSDPLVPLVGIRFQVAADVTVTEGQPTNLAVNVNCASAGLLFVDSSPTNAPAFAWLDAITFTNTATNGVALTTLHINPHFADAGTYTVTLRAGATNNTEAFSASTNITITVLPHPALQITRWKTPTNGNWNTATNWTDGIPTSNKVAVIDLEGEYTVSLNTSTTLRSLVVGGGNSRPRLALNSSTLTLHDGGVIRTNALLAYTNSSVEGSVFTLAGSLVSQGGAFRGTNAMVIAATGSFELAAGVTSLVRPIHNFGVVTYRASSMTGDNRFTFHNRYGAVLNLRTNFSWSNNTLENSGLVAKRGGTGSALFSGTPFRNRGEVLVEVGTLGLEAGGQHLGSFEVLSNATLSLSGTHEFQPSTRIFGAGAFRSLGTVNFRGSFETKGTNTLGNSSSVPFRFLPGSRADFGLLPVIADGAVDFNTGEPRHIAHLVAKGEIRGADPIIVTNALIVNSGTFAEGGKLTIASNATLTIETGQAWFRRTVDHFGVGLWKQSTPAFGDSGVEFNNYGLFEVQANTSWNNGVFNNVGTFIRRVSTGTTTFASGIFNNTGLLQVQSGTLSFSSDITNWTEVIVDSGATLNISSGTHEVKAGASVTGNGHFQFSSGTLNFLGTYDIGGSNNFNFGTVRFQPGASVNFRSGNVRFGSTTHFNTGVPQHFGTVDLDSGTLTGSDNIVVTNLIVMHSGTLSGGGAFTVAAGARFDLASGQPDIARVCFNLGTTRYLANGDVSLNNGLFHNFGLLELHSNRSWQNGGFVNNGVVVRINGTNIVTASSVNFTNRGVLALQSGQLTFSSGTTVFDPGTAFSGDAALRFSAGTLRLNTNVNFGALKVIFGSAPTISGNFNLANNVGGSMIFSNSVTVPDSLHIAGRLVVATNQTLTINGDLIAGPTTVIENHGQINVKGSVQLNGADVIGNAPQKVASPAGFALQVEGVTPVQNGQGFSPSSVQFETTLSWTAAPGSAFTVESTADFRSWTVSSATVVEASPGRYRATVRLSGADKAFFRVMSR